MSDPFNPNATGTVKAIKDEGDRVLLYEKLTGRIQHYVIATPEQAKGIRVGDWIEYKPVAVNASLFVKKMEEKQGGWFKPIRDIYRKAKEEKET